MPILFQGMQAKQVQSILTKNKQGDTSPVQVVEVVRGRKDCSGKELWHEVAEKTEGD